MFSITSGPNNKWLRNAARESWLLPCALSPFCDYRFFIDVMKTSQPQYLTDENATAGGDMVARDNYCQFMQDRHIYEKLNYGNVFKVRCMPFHLNCLLVLSHLISSSHLIHLILTTLILFQRPP